MTGIAPIDLTDPEQARKMVEDAVAAYGIGGRNERTQDQMAIVAGYGFVV